MIEQTMKCVEIREPGGPDVLTMTERNVPVAGAGEILVKVASAGVNRPDVIQRKGLYPPTTGGHLTYWDWRFQARLLHWGKGSNGICWGHCLCAHQWGVAMAQVLCCPG